MRFSHVVAGALAAVPFVAAHPGHDHAKEMAERRAFFGEHGRRDLSHCAAKMKERGIQARAIKRRAELARKAMKKRGLKERDIDELLEVSHASDADYDLETPYDTIFASNNSCVLSPEVTEGPYYVAGEFIRSDVVDAQPGVDLYIDAQVLDVSTCEPVPNAYVEIWHTNSTGVYSGVVASGNGVGESDPTNLDNTFHRGVQETDSDGVVNFQTMFPGHYAGRTTHIHVMVHLDTEPQANGTIMSTTAAHVGQMFFDQDLISQVEELSPYAENEQALMTNAQDGILAQEAETSDPFMEYVLLGDEVGDGLLAWLSFGIDTSNAREVSAAVFLTEDGGEVNPDASMGAPPGAPGDFGGDFPPFEPPTTGDE